MKFKTLGASGPSVSEVCLGTMTWGEQNTMAESHAQLDFALDQGINFIDTAEMYPVPGRAETQGRTEEYLGHWLNRQARDKLVVATKVAGPHRPFKWIRGGPLALDRENIHAAVDASLKRLQTDYIDLYQIHWPERNVPVFGAYTFDPTREHDGVSIEEQVAVLNGLVKAGKIRYVGLSNETPWGVMRFLEASDRLGLPRAHSIQNIYHLASRAFESGLDEIALREDVGLLAYSPLAGGTLSGKYLNGAQPAGARMTLFTRFNRTGSPQSQAAIARYVGVAREAGLDPSQMALAYVDAKAFVTSTIIGATSLDQLKTNIAAFDLTLDPAVVQAIEAIHLDCPNPAL